MRRTVIALAVLAVLDLFGATRAIRAQSVRGGGLDLLLGTQHLSGGAFESRIGYMADATAARQVRGSDAYALVVAAGVAGVLAGDGTCTLFPDGHCAPTGNLRMLHAALGPAWRVGEATIRALLGPAHVVGYDDASLGWQARLDARAPRAGLVAPGAMLRFTVVPSLAGERFTMWTVGVGLAIR